LGKVKNGRSVAMLLREREAQLNYLGISQGPPKESRDGELEEVL